MGLFSGLRGRFAGMVGNLLEHYDAALFGLLAPFIAPLFFAEGDPVVALIVTYGMLPLGFLTRPCGSLFFGWIGDRFGRRQALSWSLIGMAAVTVGMGFLPTYREIGFWAPAFLGLGRMLQSFFAAGETAGGAILVLEQTPPANRGWTSSWYNVSTLVGILIASALVTWLSSRGEIQEGWRMLFWAGGLSAIGGFFLRWRGKESAEFIKGQNPQRSRLLTALKENKEAFFAIVIASGFSHITYALPFTLMNGYVPLVTSISQTEAMQANTALLVADMLLLPCFGYLAHKLGKEKVMFIGSLGCALAAVPLLALLDHASLATVIMIRLIIVILGVAFAAPYYAWAIERVPPSHRYTILAFGSAVGGQLIGAPTSAVCLWLYHVTGWCFSPGLYLMLGGILATIAVARRSSLRVEV